MNTRAYGTTAETVIKYTNAFINGFNETQDTITCIKHFPGDGTEERDQHLVLGVNEMTTDEWIKVSEKSMKITLIMGWK